MPDTVSFSRIIFAALAFCALLALQISSVLPAEGPARAFGAGLADYLAESGFGPWTPYLYQYGVGGFFFFLAIGVAGYKGVFDLKYPADRRTILFLALGFAFYASLHGGWILFLELSR